jgi:hypothetical protein
MVSRAELFIRSGLSQDPGNKTFHRKRPQWIGSYQGFSSAANGTVKEAVGKVADAKLDPKEKGDKVAGKIQNAAGGKAYQHPK